MSRALAWIGLGVALILGGRVRWTLPAQVEDLRPRPDALEYEEAARNLVGGEGYCLILDGGRYPPRYPPGFSLLLAPAMWLTGGRHGTGIWVVLASALGGIAAVWGLGLVTGGAASAVAASLLLALASLDVRWSRAVMSDVPTATATGLLALGGLLCLRRDARPRVWLALGAAVGLAALLRSTCALLALPLGAAVVVQGGVGRATAGRLLAFAAGVAAGVLPTALYGLVRFGSPFASGYDYWVHAAFFGWTNLVDRPAGGGTEGNLFFYMRLLAGGGSLYPWPVALLTALGLVLGFRRPGPARLLAALTVGTVLVLLAVYLPFFWQWDRFLLPALPLVVSLAAVPVGSESPPWLRYSSTVLVAIALVGSGMAPGAFGPPDRPLGEVAALRAIAERVEPDAVLIAHSNLLLVSRLFHDRTTRLWVPVDRCEHRALIRDLKLKPYEPASTPQSWVWDVMNAPFDSTAAEATLRALLASGRPIYYAPMLAFQAPLTAPLTVLLRSRFQLEPVATRAPTGLMRVREKP